MKICFASSECVPYVKTGGLADVSGALPKALAKLGCEVKVFLPLYKSISTIEHNLLYASDIENITVKVGDSQHSFNTWYGKLPDSDVEVYLIDCPHYFHRDTTYTSHADEEERFIFFQHALLHVMQRYNWAPDVIHCNDWQTSLLPPLLRLSYNWDKLFERTATMLSIHNIAYQGRFSPNAIYKAGLPQDQFFPGGPFELHGAFAFMKAGVHFADALSTVSPTYAGEIQTAAFGEGLEGILQSRQQDLWGILNGIDGDEWSPEKDKHIAKNFSASKLKLKQTNKKAIAEEMGLPYREDTPLIGIISRLTGQKGFELLQPILGDILDHQDVQFVVLGSGEQKYEDFFNWAHATWPDKLGVYVGYNNGLAHRIEAGADMFLMPSAFEPCGLNQMYSLKYGTVPIVHKIGGLADTVKDFHEFHGEGNGFSFYDFHPHVLKDTILRALSIYHQKDVWKGIMKRGMKEDFSWQASAEKYKALYEHALRNRQGWI